VAREKKNEVTGSSLDRSRDSGGRMERKKELSRVLVSTWKGVPRSEEPRRKKRNEGEGEEGTYVK